MSERFLWVNFTYFLTFMLETDLYQNGEDESGSKLILAQGKSTEGQFKFN